MEATIAVDSFLPSVLLSRFVAEYRIPVELPRESMINHLKMAAIVARRRLASWIAQQTAETLATVEQSTIDGDSELVELWYRAVFCLAKAAILKETATAARRPDAENLAKTGEETEDKYQEWASDALALIQGDTAVEVMYL
jgi:hypothetical protein